MLARPRPRRHQLLHDWVEAAAPGAAMGEIADEFAQAVVDALCDGAGLHAALDRYGVARGSAGLTVAEVHRSLAALRRVCHPAQRRLLDRLDVVAALAEGWAEGFLEGVVRGGCVDPLTGLTTTAFLGARLGEVYAHCGLMGVRATDAYALVVVDGHLGSDGLARAGSLVELAQRVRRAFNGGETVSVTADGRVVALVARAPDLVKVVHRLVLGLDGGRRSWPVSAWVEPLPPRAEDVGALLADLERAG